MQGEELTEEEFLANHKATYYIGEICLVCGKPIFMTQLFTDGETWMHV